MNVAGKLQKISDVYLADNAYQCKYRERRRKKEEYIETSDPMLLSFEFEDVLLQMTDISRMMNCLSVKQRERLVKHIFLGYTMQEIADAEGVKKQSIEESISTALKKIRASLDR